MLNAELKAPLKWFMAVSVVWLVLDQAVKALERATMRPGTSTPLIKGVFHLTYVRNTGAAFSSFSGQTTMFLFAALIAFVALFLLWRYEKPTSVLPVFGSALLAAGAAGNVIDRLVFGHVIDLFDVRLINFAVFNVADIGITVGAALLMVWIVFFGGLQVKATKK